MIGNQLFIDLQNYIDLTEFDSLHPEICRELATANHLAIYILQVYHPRTAHPNTQNIEIKPLSQVYNYWNLLPDSDPLKIAGN
jgi:hypothetical protein